MFFFFLISASQGRKVDHPLLGWVVLRMKQHFLLFYSGISFLSQGSAFKTKKRVSRAVFDEF